MLLTEPSAGASWDPVTVPASLPIPASMNDSQLISAIQEECDHNVTNASTQPTSSLRSIGGCTSGVETSTLDATARTKDCNSNIPVSSAGEVTADSDQGLRTNGASVAISVSRPLGITDSDGEMSNNVPALGGISRHDETTSSHGETGSSTSVVDGTLSGVQTNSVSLPTSVSRNVVATGSRGETFNNTPMLDKTLMSLEATDFSAETSNNGSLSANTSRYVGTGSGALPAEEEVRCVRCYKLRPPERCPVCRRVVDSLPTHIGTHSGKNPHVISSLLGIRTTYDDGDSERGGLGEGESVDGGGISTRPQKHKRRRDPQQCTVCGRTYTKLAAHMARMHGTGDPCMCPVCGRFLRNANTLRTHMLSRTCQKSRVCPICERTCENDAGLKSHMRSHASVDSGQTEDAAAQDHYCDDCGHAFPSAEALQAHATLHSTGRHHDCCICGRSFIHASSLRLHLRMHTGETPFECKACGRGFRSRKGLSEHQSVHTMEKRYGCMTCGRRFRLYRTYSRHLVIHSGIKRFKCDQCGMRFSFNHLRKRHMRTHSGEKPYSCADCGDRFTQWNGLYQHRQRRCGRQPVMSSPNMV